MLGFTLEAPMLILVWCITIQRPIFEACSPVVVLFVLEGGDRFVTVSRGALPLV